MARTTTHEPSRDKLNLLRKDKVLVKLGGSTIAGKTRPKIGEIDRMLLEIKRARENANVVLAHGNGALGHMPAYKYQVHKGLINGDSAMGASLTQHVSARLHGVVIERANSAGLNPLSFPVSSGATVSAGRITKWNVLPIALAIMNGFLPVTHGDVVVDTKLGVTVVPAEEPLRHLARRLRPSKVVIGSDIDGVFTANPKLDGRAALIRRIDARNIDQALASAGESTKVDVTGGMHGKLTYLYEIAEKTGAVCQIVNATVPGRLEAAVSGRRCLSTTIKAR